MPNEAMEDALDRLRRSLPAPGAAREEVWTRLEGSLRRRPRRIVLARTAGFLVGFAATFAGLGLGTRAGTPSPLAKDLAPVATRRPDPNHEIALHRSIEGLLKGVHR